MKKDVFLVVISACCLVFYCKGQEHNPVFINGKVDLKSIEQKQKSAMLNSQAENKNPDVSRV